MGVLQHIFRTPLGFTAFLSVVVLGGVSLWQTNSRIDTRARALTYVAATSSAQTASVDGADWQQEMALLGLATTSDPSAVSSHDPIAMIGPMVVAELAGQYAGLQDQGAYSPQAVTQAASSIAPNVRATLSYKTYDVSDIKTDSDTSYQRMLTYRNDLRTALSPLLDNKSSELDLYGKYVETSDPSYLSQLADAAKNYRAAAESAEALTIPRDAVNYHKDILNAMQEFATVLEQMAAHPGDVLAQAALLRTYNQAEADMYMSFNALSAYYSQKTP